MKWYIISRDMHVLAAPSTDAPKSLPIYNDKQTIQINNNTVVSTYEFTIDQQHEDAQYLQLGNYIAFVDKYQDMKLYTMMSHAGDEITQTWTCEDIGMDLINETADDLKKPAEAHPIAWYLENYVIKDSGWSIRINEISNLTRTLEFTGQSDSQLTRLGDIANQFDGAEVKFTITMSGSAVTSQNIDIYKKIGNSEITDRYINDVDLKSLSHSGTIENICTSMIGYGSSPENTGEGTEELPPITIESVKYDDGRYYSPVGHKELYDRQGKLNWSRFRGFSDPNEGEFDGYISGIFTYDTTDPNELLNRMLTELKSRSDPQETYEADLLEINADIGDYVQIAHNRYNPPIYLKARIEEVDNCYTIEGSDTGILGDYTRLKSQIDPRVQNMLDALANSSKFNYTWIRYAKDDKGNGMSSTPTNETKYIAIIPNKQSGIPSDDPKDYAGQWKLIAGIDGKDGVAGEKGADGRTSYTHFAYANNVSGTLDFSVDDPTDRAYMGTLSDFVKEDSTNPDDYIWSLIKGEQGERGIQGLQGEDGKDGIAGEKGADGKTSYTHIAYANDANGGGFSQTPDNHAYIGMYVDFEQKDSTDPTKYAWSLIKGSDGLNGKDGIAGAKGEDGKTSYTHIAYADTATGGGFSQESTNKAYMGVYVDFVQADSDDPKKYAWSLIKGADGAKGVAGAKGEDGRTPYFHSAWANSADGKSGFSTTDSVNKSYLGTYTDYTEADSTDPTKYAWSLIKGVDGKDGVAGKAGADGKTPYFHTAWADSKDGKINFSLTDATNRGYLGTYTDFVQADSTDPVKYTWTELVGNLQVGVRNLLKGTANFSDGVNSSGTVITDEVYNGNRVLKASQLSASMSYHDPYVPNTIDVAKGEYYALSFYAKTDAPSMVMKCFFYNPSNTISSINSQGFTSTSSDGLSTFTITNQWNQYWVVWRTNINTTGKSVIIGRRDKSLAGSDTGSIFINSPMLVEGNKAVGWQRAPEDVDDTIDSLQTPNLVYNAGFIGDYKVGLDGWVMEGSDKYYMTNATLYNGNHSGAINVKATVDTWWVLGSKPVAVSQGSKISYSGASFTGAGSVPTNLGAEIGCYDSSGKHFANVGGVSIPITKNTWTPFKMENVTLPAGTVKISFRYITHVQPNNQINQYISQPMMVVGEHVTPFKDNQGSGSEITQVNQGLIDANNKIAAVPHVSAQTAQPSNPKNSDQWWVLDAQGKATGFKVWNGSVWADNKIQQSMLNVVSLNAVTITGSTINGSKFTNSFDFTDLGKINFKGVTEITNGSYKTDFKIAGSNQVGHVYVQPDGLHTYMSGLNGDVNTRQSIDLAFDAISLANGSTSGTLTAADIESTDREVWITHSGGDGDYQVGLSKQFRRVWFDGVLYIPQGQWNGNIGNYNKVLKLSNSKLYPKSNKIIGVTTLGNNSETASIQVQPDGWIVVVWSSRAQRILLEGHFYNLDF